MSMLLNLCSLRGLTQVESAAHLLFQEIRLQFVRHTRQLFNSNTNTNIKMSVSRKSSWPHLFCFCSLLFATGDSMPSDRVTLEPLNSTVLLGSVARFSATVVGEWKVMNWEINDVPVLNFPISGNFIPSDPRFTAGFCNSGNTSCVEFSISDVRRQDAGSVACTLLGDSGKTAQLFVQESGTVNIFGSTMMVKEDEQVQFKCFMSDWVPEPTVTWALNGQPVDSSLYNTTSVDGGYLFNSSSVLTFQAVRNSTVECRATVSALTTPKSASVFLVVDPKPTDWTVLIAVVVSIGGFALLVLLIIGIIFCYKRRKEKQPSYEKEMRRMRTQSQLSGVTAPGQRRGQVNAGYVTDGQTSVASSDVTDSGFSQVNGSSYHEMPDVVNSNQAGNGFINLEDDLGFKKHRHVTIV